MVVCMILTVHGRLLALDGHSRGAARTAGVETGAIAQADLVRGELVQGLETKECSLLAHFDEVFEAGLGGCGRRAVQL
jgi:hypothetical protein